MGDVILDEMRSRNRRYIMLIIAFLILFTLGVLYFQLPSNTEEDTSKTDKTKETNQATQNKTADPPKQNKTTNTSENDSQNKTNQTAQNDTPKLEDDGYDFTISEVKYLDERACGASPERLFSWFGNPLYPMGWEKTASGGRGDPNSFKFFVWNKSTIFTKGKYNETTNMIQTYHYISRENINNTLEKIVDCSNLNTNSSS